MVVATDRGLRAGREAIRRHRDGRYSLHFDTFDLDENNGNVWFAMLERVDSCQTLYDDGWSNSGQMNNQTRAEHRERVVRTGDYNTGGSAPDSLDADHIRVHLCANAQYAVDNINRAIADALEAGELVEREGGYVVANE